MHFILASTNLVVLLISKFGLRMLSRIASVINQLQIIQSVCLSSCADEFMNSARR